MTKQGHQRISVGVALMTVAGEYALTHTWAWVGIAAIFAIIGGTAPDWLEIAKWKNGVRQSVIPHRTITHWMMMWMGLLGYAAFQLHQPNHSSLEIIAFTVLLGFTAGGLSHVFSDYLTPMGVPVINPMRRKTMYLVHSTALENPIAIGSLIIGGCALWAAMVKI